MTDDTRARELIEAEIARNPYTHYAYPAGNDAVERQRATRYARSIALRAITRALASHDPSALFEAIKHGDEDHRAWLREAVTAFYAGQPVPPARGGGRKEARIAELEVQLAALASPQDVGVERAAWQPIETAPKDGTKITALYADGTEESGVYYAEERYCMLGAPQGSRGKGWVSTEAGNLPVDAPTHWRPEAPSQPERAAAQPVDEDEVDGLLDTALGLIQPLTGQSEDYIWRPANKAWKLLFRARAILASRSPNVETVCAYEAGLADGRAKGLEAAKTVAEDEFAKTGMDIAEIRQKLSPEELSARGYIASTASRIASAIDNLIQSFQGGAR